MTRSDWLLKRLHTAVTDLRIALVDHDLSAAGERRELELWSELDKAFNDIKDARRQQHDAA